MKKTIVIFIATSLFALQLWGQEYRYTAQGETSTLTVEIANFISELKVEGHNSNEIVIQAKGYEGIPEKAKGLKPLSAYGEDNTGIGLNLLKEGNFIRISGVSRASSSADYVFKIPQNMKFKVNSESFNADDIKVTGMKGELEIKANASDLVLKNVNGPLVLHTLNGDIYIQITVLSQVNPSSIHSMNGDIDITMPASSNVNFELSSMNGEIFTDLDIKLDEEAKGTLARIGGDMNAKGALGSGGEKFRIDALNGNIYLRKK